MNYNKEERRQSFEHFLFGRMNKDRDRHRKEAKIKQDAALTKALKNQIASRPTEEQLVLIDELVADGQRKGLPITRELVLFAMRPARKKEKPCVE